MSLQLLLVDDDQIVTFLHQRTVEKSGLASNPVCFADGQDTLDYLDEQASINSPYLILLDINMPVMDGWEFLEAIQDKPYADSLMVIMVTSSIDFSDKEKAFKYKQVLDFIVKPLTVDTCQRLMVLPALSQLINTV